MSSSLPVAMKWSTRAVGLFLLASQIHLFVVLRRRLRAAGLPGGELSADLIAGAVAALGFALIATSEMVQLDAEIIFGRRPGIWHLLSAAYTAGSFGAYAVYLAWLGAERFVGPLGASHARVVGKQHAPTGVPRRKLLAAAGKLAIAAPFAVAGYGTFIGRTSFSVHETELELPGLHPDLDGLSVAQVTDIHYGPYLTARDLKQVVGMTNELRPDLTMVTGDLITHKGDPLDECVRILGDLRADSGVWGCLGNHEGFAECETLASDLALDRDIHFLRNQREELRFGGAKLNLVGVDYQRRSRPYLVHGRSLLDPDAFNLLLSHNPDVFPRAAELGYDLVVAGHTHGGQVTLEIVEQSVNAGRFFTPFVVGEYRLPNSALYVSRGVGTVNMPMRIGALPEITLLRLRRA